MLPRGCFCAGVVTVSTAMTREADNGDGDAAEDAPLRGQQDTRDAERENTDYREHVGHDGDESNDDFELETMEDDGEDGEDGGEVDEDDEDDLEEDEEDEDNTAEEDEDDSPDASVGSLDDELMALVDDAAGGGARPLADGDYDRIAHRTRTKVSLVSVDIDLLESLLPPDPVKSSDIFNEDSHEYQRFLSSLLPTGAEEDNLSFLDEEDEEYEPDEDEDDDEADEDEMMDKRGNGRGEKDYELHQQSVRVSKKELTELLWDSTQLAQQLKVPPTFPRTPTAASFTSGGASVNESGASLPASHVSGQTIEDMADAAALKDVKGTISQEQCIQLASQMHKHFQLLLQTYYLVTSTASSAPKRSEKRGHREDPEAAAAAEAAAKTAAKAAAKEQLEECKSMLRELQIRGKRALQHKAQLLSKLTINNGTGGAQTPADDLLEQRRVTRSISAARAAVAHPSMFDIVGSQSIDQLTAQFRRGCSIGERNQGLQSSLQEVDKHILLNRKRRRSRPQGNRKLVFSQAEDRLLFQGVKRHGVNPEAWREIHETLIPTKDPVEISKRYRYLCSRRKRGGPSAFKEYHSEHHTRKWAKWMIEEDVRLARGVVEYFGDNRRFSRISSKYLPHRHRLEIRKRWERLKRRYLIEDGSVAPADASMPPIAAGRVFAVAVKQFFENVLREEVKSQTAAVVIAPSGSVGLRNKRKSPKGKRGPVPVPVPVPTPIPDDTGDSDTEAPEPTLEVTGCGLKNLHPALFFSSWAVINPATLLAKTCEHNWPAFINAKRQDTTSESTLDMVSRAAVSRVEEETAEHRATLASKASQLEPIREENEEDDSTRSDTLDVSLDTIDSDDDGIDEDSEFEQDELLSSEDEDTDSEYEQLEMSDDDDDDDGNESVDEDDDTGDEGGHAKVDPPLRLANLSQPDKMRAKRTLEALERRLTGDRPTTTARSSFGATGAADDDGDFTMSGASFDDNEDLDLFAYEELSDGDDDVDDDGEDDEEGFEQDELHSSSSGSDNDVDEDSMPSGQAGAERSKRTREASAAQPLKRVKLPRCADCGSAPCVCSTLRMQRLMQRIQPHDGVHETLP